MESFSVAQRAFAEAIGTALLVFIGAGSVPAILLLEGGTKAPFSGADLGFISMAFGLVVPGLLLQGPQRESAAIEDGDGA